MRLWRSSHSRPGGLRLTVPALVAAAALSGAAAAPGQEAAAAPPEPGVLELIERIEARQRSFPHFEARFEQTFSPRIFGRERSESGRLIVKRPGRMRWDYETPEPKVFVSDGANTWFHVPADQRVVVGAFGPADARGDESRNQADGEESGSAVNPLDFLTGRAEILDHFDALESREDAPGRRALSLIPRRLSGEIASLRLTVEEGTGQIRTIESEDQEGNRTTFEFSDFRSGPAPPDSLFRFTIPPGTDVVTASGLRE